MKISAKGKTFIACIVGLFLLIGVPLIINACYSAETVIFQTQWDAADVLSYYGTIMGAAVTVGALAVTIRFTKKQIDRESYAKSRKEKWFKIEQIINNALEKNSPNLLHEIGLLHYSDGLYFQEIQKYVVNACAAINRVSCDINADDAERLGSLAIKIVELHNKVVDHCIHYGYKGNLLATDGNNDGTPPSETYVSSQKILIDLNGGLFRDILDLKREAFEKIYAEIESESNSILQLWGKKADADARMDRKGYQEAIT